MGFPELSNVGCLPGKAGGSPFFSSCDNSDSTVHTVSDFIGTDRRVTTWKLPVR